MIFLNPYLKTRQITFCPGDRTPRSSVSRRTSWALMAGSPRPINRPGDSELGQAERGHLTIQSYLLNSIFTHKSARYALERALPGLPQTRSLPHYRTRTSSCFRSEIPKP